MSVTECSLLIGVVAQRSSDEVPVALDQQHVSLVKGEHGHALPEPVDPRSSDYVGWLRHLEVRVESVVLNQCDAQGVLEEVTEDVGGAMGHVGQDGEPSGRFNPSSFHQLELGLSHRSGGFLQNLRVE